MFCLQRSLFGLLLAMVGLCALGSDGRSSGADRWRAMSDTLFVHQPTFDIGTALAQDASGFLWAGGQAGLSRWDGYRFRRYTAESQVAGSLPDGYIRVLHADSQGRLWVGTNAAGLLFYDASFDRFVATAAVDTQAGSRAVFAIADDGSGGLWVATGTGIEHRDGAGRPLPAAQGGALSLPKGALALLVDRSGALWAGTPGGLLRRPAGSALFSAVPLDAALDEQPWISRLVQDSAGAVWVGTRYHGAFTVDPSTLHARAVDESGPGGSLRRESVVALVESLPGEMWLGTDSGGIVVLDVPSGTTRRIRHQFDNPGSLADNDVPTLLRDRSGLVWVGSLAALSRHDPQQRALVSVFGGTGRPDAISQTNVPSLLMLPDGRVWMGVGNGGADVIDPLRGRVAQLTPDPGRPLDALPNARVIALAAAPNGDVFIGTRRGLYRSDAAGRRVRRVQVPGRGVAEPVWALHHDAGVLWLGGFDGLWQLAVGPTDVPTLLSHAVAGFRDQRITAITHGPGGALWVGTQDGVVQLDAASGAVRSPADGAAPLPGGYITALLVDRRGRLWTASGTGVQVQQAAGADGQPFARRIGTAQGLPHNSVAMLLEDARGDIWASTDGGLALIDGSSLAVRALRQPEGAEILGYWSNAGVVSAAGELLFGGLGGVTVVRPDRLTRWTFKPPVVVTEARVGSAVLAAGRFNMLPGAVTPLPIEIPAADRTIEFEFAALDYSAPERNHYAYRLDGFDHDWIDSDATRRLAHYTNLPPGDYTLRLRGSNRDGVWTSTPLAVPIRVLPAWYQTLWFRLAEALVIVALFAAGVRWRTARLQRRQLELQGLVAERTAELEQRTAALRQSQQQLEQMAYADPLTGLPNRRLFNEDLRHGVALALRDGRPFTLLLIDLDRFKEVNDVHGHDAGDAVLQATAVRLKLAVREADRVARLGGDEFAVVLTQTGDRETVDVVCRRILAGLIEPVPFQGQALQVAGSIGAALCPQQGSDPDALYKAADVALYDAKRGGRNTWRWYGQGECPGEPVSASPTAPRVSGGQPA